MSTDLITSRDLLPTVFDSAENLDAILTLCESDARAETHDVTTKAGRKGIASLAHRVSRSKTAIADIGDPLAMKFRVKWDVLNVMRSTANRRLDALRDEIKAPLTEWRDAEAARVKAHEDRLAPIKAIIELSLAIGSEDIREHLAWVCEISLGDFWEEFADDAIQARAQARRHLTSILIEAEKAEAAAAELEALRLEKAERIQDEREAQDERDIQRRIDDAAEKASAAEKTKADAALEAEKDKSEREHREGERRVADAQRQADEAIDRERAEVTARKAIEQAACEARAADEANRKHVIEMAKRALVAAPVKLSPHDANKVVGAIADKLVPYLHIKF